MCPDGNRPDTIRTAGGTEISSNGRPSFSKTTVVLQSRAPLPTFARTPPPSSLVIGMPHFDQKLDELTAERKAARCAAEAMANLCVLPVAAMSLPPAVSGTVDSLQSVAVASAAEPVHRASPLTTVSSSSAVTSMEVEASDVTDTFSASHTDKYSSYDRHFKKKFFGSERRPQGSEPVTKVSDADLMAADSGRDGNTPSPDVASSVVCKKARLADPSRNTISPLCTSVRTPTPPISEVLPSTTSVSHECRPLSAHLSGDDMSHRSPGDVLVLTPVSSAVAASSVAEVASSAGETSAQFSSVEASPAVTQSISDSSSSRPAGCVPDHE